MNYLCIYLVLWYCTSLPGESHEQRSLVDCSPWGRKSWTHNSATFISFHLILYIGILWFSLRDRICILLDLHLTVSFRLLFIKVILWFSFQISLVHWVVYRKATCSVNKDSFMLFSPVCISFISFFRRSLVAFTRTSSVMVKQSSERGHPCLIADLSGKASSFLDVDFFVDTLSSSGSSHFLV